MSAMPFEIGEILATAIMSGTPVLIVEGIDDVQTYDLIARSAQTEVEIFAVETIIGYSGGSEHVIKAIQALAALEQAAQPFDHYILGIVDRDVREYRNTLPTESAILVLEGYSIETHFVTQEVLYKAILNYTKTTANLIGQQRLGQIMANIENTLLDLHYLSLEALKCALIAGYDAAFSYQDSCARRKDATLQASLKSKKEELDQFGNSLGIVRNMQHLRKISKGKWLLEVFCVEIQSALKTFQTHCGVGDFVQCQPCAKHNSASCLYRAKVNLDFRTIYELAQNDGSLASLQYIRDRIHGLPAAAQLRQKRAQHKTVASGP